MTEIQSGNCAEFLFSFNEHCCPEGKLCLMAFPRLPCTFVTGRHTFSSSISQIWHRIFRIKNLAFSTCSSLCFQAYCCVYVKDLKCFWFSIPFSSFDTCSLGDYNIISRLFLSLKYCTTFYFFSVEEKWIFMMASKQKQLEKLFKNILSEKRKNEF